MESTPRKLTPLLLGGVVLACALFAAPAFAAGTFTVTLENGTTFETRYRPVEAPWDDDVALMMTDQGNWISLRKDEIADVVSQFEESGFGYQVDTTTMFLGYTPNDLVDDGEGDEEGSMAPDAYDRRDVAPRTGPNVPRSDAFGYGSAGGYSLDQFVDPIGGGTIPNGPTYGDNADEGNTRIE